MSDAAPVARFSLDCEAALGRAITPKDVLAIAVSGGPDSIMLLALAAAAWPDQVIAATVDHGLRPAAADEAAMVARFCSVGWPAQKSPGAPKKPIPHAILRPAVPIGPTNVQAMARTVRYEVLTDWARAAPATILATAHHADDQAETFVMRAVRGSGLAGLAAIRPCRHLDNDLALLRPLLDWRRAELRLLAETWGLPFVDDPSNSDDHYDRTRFRDLLRREPWLNAERIARSAAHLAEAERDLQAIETWLRETRLLPADAGERRIDVTGLPREMCRRLVRAAITELRTELAIHAPRWSSASNVESLLDALEAGKGATQAAIMVSADAEIWRFRAAPPRRNT